YICPFIGNVELDPHTPPLPAALPTAHADEREQFTSRCLPSGCRSVSPCFLTPTGGTVHAGGQALSSLRMRMESSCVEACCLWCVPAYWRCPCPWVRPRAPNSSPTGARRRIHRPDSLPCGMATHSTAGRWPATAPS